MAKSRKRKTPKNNGCFGNKNNQIKNVNIKTFWKGSVISDLDISYDGYKQLKPTLDNDLFNLYPSQIKESINYLDDVENRLFHGGLEIDQKEMIQIMSVVNSLIKKGHVKNDNMNGIMTIMAKKDTMVIAD